MNKTLKYLGLIITAVILTCLISFLSIIYFKSKTTENKEINSFVGTAFINSLERLGTLSNIDVIRRDADSLRFSELYRRTILECDFSPKYKLVYSDSNAVQFCNAKFESELMKNIIELENRFLSDSRANISRAKLYSAITTILLLGSSAEQAELNSRSDCAGLSAALCLWLEKTEPKDPALPLLKSWTFYLAGDAVAGFKEIESKDNSPEWEMRRNAVRAYITRDSHIQVLTDTTLIYDSAAVKPILDEEIWMRLLKVIASTNVDKAVEYIRNDTFSLLPRLITFDKLPLGDTRFSIIMGPSQAAFLIKKYLNNFHDTNTQGVMSNCIKLTLKSFLRYSAVKYYLLYKETYGIPSAARNFVKDITVSDTCIGSYLEAYDAVKGGRLDEGIKLYREIKSILPDYCYLHFFIRELPEKFGAPFVNELADSSYKDWIRYKENGLAYMRYGWYRKAISNYEKSLELNPWQKNLINSIKYYSDVDSGILPDISETEPLTLAYNCFSIYDDSMETALNYFLKHPEYEIKRGWVSTIASWMYKRGWHDTAIEWGLKKIKDWPPDLMTANFSANLGYMIMYGRKSPELALERFQKMVYFGNGANMLGMADAYEMLDKLKEAEEWQIKNDERYGEAATHFMLASFYVRRGEIERAKKAMGKPEEFATPNQRRAFFKWAMTWIWNESYPSLVRYIYEGIVTDRKSWISYDYSQWALACFVMKDYLSATKILDEAVKEEKTNPFMDYIRYAIHCRNGDWNKACEALKNTNGDYYHRYLPHALVAETSKEELLKYARGKPMYQSYLSSMWGLLGYKYLAHGDSISANNCFKIDAESLKYADWHLPIMASHELNRKIIIGLFNRKENYK